MILISFPSALVKVFDSFAELCFDESSFKSFLSDIASGLRVLGPYKIFNDTMRNFVRRVCCTSVHPKVEDNIAELRLFHSTTIGFVAKLQDNYLKKELEIRALKKMIIALEFRYLLEHLPDPKSPCKDKTGSGLWKYFWTQALKEEADDFQSHNLTRETSIRISSSSS